MAISSESATQTRDSLNGMTLDTRSGSYILRKVIYRCVVRAQRTDASLHVHAPSLVIKLSLPPPARPSEEKQPKNATASRFAIHVGGDSHRGAQHLPRILRSEDLPIMAQPDAAEILCDASCKTCNGDFLFDENRPLRIVIVEELLPIETLSDAADYAQVFFDVLNGHKWLYNKTRILHRDISVANIMYRRDHDGAVYGVLNDMDLSSDLKATTMRRTHTPPFMAIDLLRKDSVQPDHIYRHDLESLLYVMLILFVRYELVAAGPTSLPMEGPAERLVKRRKPPLSEWFNPNLSWDTLGVKKFFFITNCLALNSPLHLNHILSSSFQGFRTWISRLKRALTGGIVKQTRAVWDVEDALENGEEPPSFVYETLGGEVQYSTFFKVMKKFGDEVLRAPPYSLDTDPTA